MGMSFSNAAIKFSDINQAIEIATNATLPTSIAPFSSFYIQGPIDGWICLYAPGTHPANSAVLATAISQATGVPGFAGFVSQSDKIAMRFFENGDIFYEFMYEIADPASFESRGEIFQLFVKYAANNVLDENVLESILRKTTSPFAEDLYRNIIKILELPPELDFMYFEKASKMDMQGELLKDFGEKFAPKLISRLQ